MATRTCRDSSFGVGQLQGVKSDYALECRRSLSVVFAVK